MKRLAAVAMLGLVGCGAPTEPQTGFKYASGGEGALSAACWVDNGQWSLEREGDSCCTAVNHGQTWHYSFNGVSYTFALVGVCDGGSR